MKHKGNRGGDEDSWAEIVKRKLHLDDLGLKIEPDMQTTVQDHA